MGAAPLTSSSIHVAYVLSERESESVNRRGWSGGPRLIVWEPKLLEAVQIDWDRETRTSPSLQKLGIWSLTRWLS